MPSTFINRGEGKCLQDIHHSTAQLNVASDGDANNIKVIRAALTQLQEVSASHSTYADLLVTFWDDICQTLGAERTREELIPCVQAIVNRAILENDQLGMPADEHEGFLYLITVTGSAASKSIDYVGGSEHIDCLLGLVCDICASSDLEIREQGIAALERLVDTSIHSKSGTNAVARRIDTLMCSENVALQLTACRVWPLLLTFELLSTEPENLDVPNTFLSSYLQLFYSYTVAVRREAVLTIPIVSQRLLGFLSSCLPEEVANVSSDPVENANKNYVSSLASSSSMRSNPTVTWIFTSLSKLLDVFLHSSIDESEAVRLVAARIFPEILPLFAPPLDDDQAKFLNTFQKMAEDASWMIRCTIARTCFGMAANTERLNPPQALQKNPSPYKGFVFEKAVGFLNDSQAEVRIASIVALGTDPAAKSIAKQLDLKEQSEVLELLKIGIGNILAEESLDLTFCVAENLVAIASLFDAKLAMQNLFLIFTQCLRTVPPLEVRLAAFQSLIPDISLQVNLEGDGSEWLTMPITRPLQNGARIAFFSIPDDDIRTQFLRGVQYDGVSSAAEALEDIISSLKWRLRHVLLLVTPAILPYISTDSALYSFLLSTLLNGLSDDIHMIRCTACNCCVSLIRMGIPWRENDEIFNVLRKLAKNRNYIFRMSLVRFQLAFLISGIFADPGDDMPTLLSRYQELFELSVKDGVSNVKVQLFSSIVKQLPGQNKYPPDIVSLWRNAASQAAASDTSPDVKHAAHALILQLKALNYG